ncbi:uncharacterized protein LY89DRAFT_723916 [Mollisia scopiformis]|uniref:Uncharacterized protein n=1 Tax=Mollisia scopiformis TaxID=149040 RepID=A0A132BD06_MOLSC|nr:uncharacterized protein LY89DRAFT_723916 [Mollisia scopiformis]KUJ10133.1 hypothetical protein LY89DRAFT_723916 [Mollisia scopiformis]
METVNNIASAASRAIWGESAQTGETATAAGTEPVSGKTGNVEAGEPYDKGNDGEPVNNTSSSTTTDSKLPTYLNYQKENANTDTTTSKDTTTNSSTDTPSTAPTTTPSNTTTSKMTDNTPSTSIEKPTTSSTDDSSTTAPPSNRSDPAPAAQSAANQEAIQKSTPADTTPADKNDDKEDDEATQQAGLKADGITETSKEGDHAPKFDTFKTSDGPHIGDGKNDGRVGPPIEKGDLKEFENHDGSETKKEEGEGKVEGKVAEEKHAHHGEESVKKDTESAERADSPGKEKVSLKDKIKAKLHKH